MHLLHFCCCLLLDSILACFDVEIRGCCSFCACFFCFVDHILTIMCSNAFFLFNIDCLCTLHFPAIAPLYILWAPRPCLPKCCIFWPCAHITKHALIARFAFFLPCFCFRSWTHTLLHPSEPIRIHLHSLLTIFGKTHKTSCPGKFPRP